jgi:hypothetical protein
LRDLRGMSEAEIGDRLDLYDTDEASAGSDRCRRARGYISSGRRRLAELGAWPWTLEPTGRPERRWWTVEKYAAALLAWHEMVCLDAIEDVLRPARGLTTPPIWRSTAASWETARTLYREQLAVALAEADQRAA